MDRKVALLNAIAPVRRGLAMSEPQRQAIFSAVAFLEERNPTPQPTGATALLSGNWRLLFTTSQSLLGFDRFPGVQLGEIYQYVNVSLGKIFNVAELNSLPLLGSIVSVGADITVASSQRVQVQFTRSVLGLQTTLGYRNVSSFLQQLERGDRLFALDFPINGSANAWLDITYLDNDLRIGRGNEGNLYVLRKVTGFNLSN